MSGLPNGWVREALENLIQPKSERISPQDRPNAPYIGLEHVQAHTNEILGTVSASSMSSSSASFNSGEVLYGRMRPYLNKVVRPQFSGLASAEFIVFPKAVAFDSSFLLRRLSSTDFVEFACSQYEGDRPRVKFDALGKFQIDLPPKSEQTRIVAKLEELLSDLDAGVAELKAAQKKLTQYRQSLLKAAVDGSLTAEWRKSNPPTETCAQLLERILNERRARWQEKQLAKFAEQGKTPPKDWQKKYPEPVQPDTTDLPVLPEGWAWATLSQVGWLDRGRSKHRPRNAPHLYGGIYPFVQTGDIRHADTFLSEVEASYSEAGLAQSRLWPAGTMCITIAANIGKTAILSMNACFPDSVVGLLPVSNEVTIRYVEYFMRSIQQKLEDEAPATAQKNINLEILEKVVIAIPPAQEQLQLVNSLEQAFLSARDNEVAIERSLKQAAAQRQNILRAAFSGQLVPQDPNDEPASVLLERIRAERSQQNTIKKPRGRKAKETNNA